MTSPGTSALEMFLLGRFGVGVGGLEIHHRRANPPLTGRWWIRNPPTRALESPGTNICGREKGTTKLDLSVGEL
jgi:hypothetical protein